MQSLVVILAILGAVALIVRLLRALMRFVLRAAEITAASGLAEISARRGDLTGMVERQAAVRVARRGRRTDLLLALFWLLWLAAPPFTAWTREAYALAAPLWLLPVPPVRIVNREG